MAPRARRYLSERGDDLIHVAAHECVLESLHHFDVGLRHDESALRSGMWRDHPWAAQRLEASRADLPERLELRREAAAGPYQSYPVGARSFAAVALSTTQVGDAYTAAVVVVASRSPAESRAMASNITHAEYTFGAIVQAPGRADRFMIDASPAAPTSLTLSRKPTALSAAGTPRVRSLNVKYT